MNPDIRVNIGLRHPWRDPWLLELERPGHETYHAECRVVLDTSGDNPTVQILWMRRTHAPDVRQFLEKAIQQRIVELLPKGASVSPTRRDGKPV